MRNTIVITMAGLGSRFTAAGYTMPKYEIRAHGRNLFQWSLLSLQQFIGAQTRMIFVCLRAHQAQAFLQAQCAALGISDFIVLELDALTDGQATSAYLSHAHWLPDAPVLIYNIDTYVKPRALAPSDIPAGAVGWIPCFQAPGTHWSFVKLGADGWAEEVAEKRRISDYASIGLYWFDKPARYLDAYQQHFAQANHLANNFANNLVRGERYIAPMYQTILAQPQHKVAMVDVDPNAVFALGTPDELNIFLAKPLASIV